MSFVPVAVGILKREKKVLVSCRPQGKPYSGYWEFPGGKIESHENGLKALQRELQEELGIIVQEAKSWFTHTHHYPDKSIYLEIWVVEKFSGEPVSQENQILRWVNFEEMLSLKLLEGNIPILEKIHTIFF